MSREDDWKIHTLMGNDLTGYEWFGDDTGNYIWNSSEGTGKSIPYYSTTWEGAGLVMEWLRERDIHFGLGSSIFENGLYQASVHIGSRRPAFYEESAPLALCKAYISAMEERNNG